MEHGPLQSLDRITQGSPAAATLLALIVIASLVVLKKPAWRERLVFRPFWVRPRREYLTVLTSAFIHADLAHLLFNAITFYAFGFALERQLGAPLFLTLYAFGIVASAAGTWLWHRNESGYATLGASGAILAVLFASIVYFPKNGIYILPIPFPIPAPIFAFGYLLFSWIAARRGGGRVNHDAHFFGAIAGVAFVALTDFGALARALASIGL